MRSATLTVLVSIGTIVSCSSPSEVLVTRSEERATTAGTDETVPAPSTPSSSAVEEQATPTTEFPSSAPTIEPDVAPEVEQEVEPATGEFPPSDEDWATHRLAALAPSPDEIGPGWSFDYGSRAEAAPADPDDALPECDAPVPPTFDGFDLSYSFISVGQPIRELQMSISEGDVTGAQVWIDAISAIADCTFSSSGFNEDFDLSSVSVSGADDASILTSAMVGDGAPVTQVIAVARVDGLVVAAYFAIEPDIAADDAAATVAQLLSDTLARR